ncbi:MAG: SH3 domain-containing protein [Agathobacter sp.]|nr:SH3 domain-containing protein [Agathobacter sp.]
MKKSKHFRKDVILARIIAAVLLIVLIAVLIFAISHFTKPSGPDKDSQNTENTQNVNQGNQDTEFVGDEDTQEQTTEENKQPETTPEPEPSVDAKTYVKTTANLNLRVEPNTSCSTLASIPKDTKIEVVEDLERWYKVIYNGQEGYVSKTYVVVVDAE